jgi:hypothetical protein
MGTLLRAGLDADDIIDAFNRVEHLRIHVSMPSREISAADAVQSSECVLCEQRN